MSGDCREQPAIFYTREMTHAKRIAIEHVLEKGTTPYVKTVDTISYLCRWRNGSVMQE